MEIGDAFLLDDRSIDPHLWIVISDPAADSERVVIVNLTSHDDPAKDASCILDKGDHPWITHATSVRYKDARLAAESQLDELTRTARLKPQAPVSDAVLSKIFQGAERTELLALKCRTVLVAQGLIPG